MKICFVGDIHTDISGSVGRILDESALPIVELHTTEENTGVPASVKTFAENNNLKIVIWSPNWNDLTAPKAEIRKRSGTNIQYNKRAGVNRNEAMVVGCDAFIMVWDYESGGCADLLRRIEAHNKPVYQVKIPKKTD